jgi:hypothetical protein
MSSYPILFFWVVCKQAGGGLGIRMTTPAQSCSRINILTGKQKCTRKDGRTRENITEGIIPANGISLHETT